MSALLFLGIAVVLSLAGGLVLWLRSRQPGSMDAHIRDFARELDALAPGSGLPRAGWRRDEGPGPERPFERGPGPERPFERETGPERPFERETGPERPFERETGPERGTGGRPSG